LGAFGENLAEEDPDSNLISYSFPLRFPGQYRDSESGLHYNYFRDYEAGTGRYVESDPIGLEGGLATYEYAISNPLTLTDPEGQHPAAAAGAAIGYGAFRICMRIPACRIKLADLGKKAAELCKKISCTVRFDKEGHRFNIPGAGVRLCMHWQIDCHIKGVKGLHFSIYSRLPICWKPGEPFPRDRPPRTAP